MKKLIFALATLTLIAIGQACTTSQAYCARTDECSEDENEDQDSDNGADDIAICTENQDGMLRALRANAEPECSVFADALVGWNNCKASLSCQDFNAENNNGKCEEEKEIVVDTCDLLRDEEIDCESLYLFTCGFGF